MNAGYFALTLVTALNPKLLAIDLLLIENQRPRAMFRCVLLSLPAGQRHWVAGTLRTPHGEEQETGAQPRPS